MGTKIEYLNYELELETNAPTKFNLYKKTKIKNKKTGDESDGRDVLGYGLSLETCIKKITNLEITKKDRVIELKQFIEEYKQAFEEVKKYLTA
jgi:hypothetical protein